MEEVIFDELERLKTEPVSDEELGRIKSNLKYSFANSLSTSDGIAGMLAFYINLASDPGTVNRLFSLYDRVTPQDIMDVAAKYFRRSNSTVATLSGGGSK